MEDPMLSLGFNNEWYLSGARSRESRQVLVIKPSKSYQYYALDNAGVRTRPKGEEPFTKLSAKLVTYSSLQRRHIVRDTR